MTQERTGVDAEDAEAISAYEAALRDFSIELNRLHIAYGAPSYATIVKASVNPKLTKAGINEALSGKRLPSIDSLMEFIRVVSNPLPPTVEVASPRCQPELADAWRARWQETKFAQRRAQAPWRRLRDTVRETLDEAYREAEAVRAAAHAEADRIVAEARQTVLGVPFQQTSGEQVAPGVDDGTPGPVKDQATSDVLDQMLRAPLDVEEIRTLDLAALRAGLTERRSVSSEPGSPEFQSFWFAVPKPTDLFPEDGGTEPLAELAPGTWYLAVAEKGEELIAQTADGRRGLVRDVSDLQRG